MSPHTPVRSALAAALLALAVSPPSLADTGMPAADRREPSASYTIEPGEGPIVLAAASW